MFASLHIGVISLRFPFRMRLPFSACIALLTSVLLLAWAAVAPGAAGQVEFTEAEDSSVLTGVRLGSSSIADVNGDGNKDLLITGSGTATLYLGDGQGGFAKADASSVLAGVAGSSSSVADVNGDGHKDLLIIGADANFDPAATLYLGDGQGGFAKADASSNLTGVNEGSSSIADVDGDGNKDLLITGEDPDTSRTATLYRGDGTGGFAEADASSNLTGVMNSSSSIADVDGDGNKDLLITGFADNGRTATLYFGDGQGGFAKADASSTLTGVYESSSSIADVDGDGNKDLLITGGDPNPNPTATLYFGDGQGGFTEADASSILTGVYGGSSSIADVDGDGDKDLLITGSGTATLYLGDGQGGFAKADARLVQTGVYESSSSIADVDGDGNKDLLITGRDANYNPMAKLYLQQAGVRDTVLRVDQSVSSPGPGTSWNNAYQSLQNALAAADTTGATEIWVAEGAYHPDEGSSVRDGRRDTSFVLQNGVAIYGGFSGNEQSRSGRDVESNRTIFSGEIQRDGDQSNNSYHVVNASTVDSTAVLDGVTVEGGRANGSGLAANGGGLLADRGGPTIRNVTFRNNFASNGGGVALVNSGPNSASKTARLSGTRFIQNRAETRGGGLYVGGTDAEMARAEIRGNEALLGGGLATGSHSTVRAVSSLLSGNVAEASGGAVQTDQIENTSSTDTLDLVNTTIAGNRSPRGGGLRLEGRFDVRLTNSIVWNNSRGGGGQIIADNAALRIERSAIQGRDNISQLGLRGGAGAIADQADDASVYPRFVRPVLPGRAPTTEGDFHLQKPTLLEDAGTGSVLSGSSKDLDGESRVAGEDVDIGAYEGAVSTTAPDFTFSEKRVPRSFVDGSNLERQSISKDVALRFRYTDAPSSAPSQLFVYRASQGSPMFEKIAEIPAPEDLASTSEYVDTSAEPEKQYRYAVAAPGAATPVFSRQMSSAVQAFNTPLVGGTVVRNSDESPLSGAQISVKDVTGVRAVTDRKGRYLLDGLNAGLRGYQIVATSGLDSSTRTLEKGLNERQQRVRIVDFTLAATSVSEVELQPVLSSRDREPIDVPYYGEAF
jgi:predicted outer membrane repeat protein